jgi:hypothetical protein
LGGEAQKTRFHFRGDPTQDPGVHRPEGSGGVSVWGLVLHMALMIPLVPTTVINALVTVLSVVYLRRALASPAHHTLVNSRAAPTSALALAVFLVVTVVGLGLLVWVLSLLARVALDGRRWRMALVGALGMLVLGAAVWAFTGTGLPATASVFGAFIYVALVALGHMQWARRHPGDRRSDG